MLEQRTQPQEEVAAESLNHLPKLPSAGDLWALFYPLEAAADLERSRHALADVVGRLASGEAVPFCELEAALTERNRMNMADSVTFPRV